MGIYNGNGDLKATYSYDSWGNVTGIKDADGAEITNPNHVANLNPFRYRGYYMDTETGLYYLMSRYYDPVTHRFVNSDGYFQSGNAILDANMNAYCRNNPINYFDPTGESPYSFLDVFGEIYVNPFTSSSSGKSSGGGKKGKKKSVTAGNSSVRVTKTKTDYRQSFGGITVSFYTSYHCTPTGGSYFGIERQDEQNYISIHNKVSIAELSLVGNENDIMTNFAISFGKISYSNGVGRDALNSIRNWDINYAINENYSVSKGINISIDENLRKGMTICACAAGITAVTILTGGASAPAYGGLIGLAFS